MSVLTALRVLPDPGADQSGDGGAAEGSGDTGTAGVSELLLRCQLDLMAQLLLLGGMCEWAVYVALGLPSTPSQPHLRSAAVAELLASSVPEWHGDVAKEAFLTQRLGLPRAVLDTARATHAAYRHDARARCAALLGAGHWRAAHALLASDVAPRLFLDGAIGELRSLLAQLVPHAPGLPDWDTGGGLFLAFLDVAAAPECAAEPRDASGVDSKQLETVLSQLHAACGKWPAMGSGAISGGEAAACNVQLRRQLVFSKMAATLHNRVVGVAGRGGAPGGAGIAALIGVLGVSCLPADLRMSGVATAAAVAAAAVQP
eukprot:100385-Chlamydomonas_euryale.AAC.24